MPLRHNWRRRSAVAVVVLLLVALLVVPALGVVGVQQGVVRAPTLLWQFGNYRLIAVTTTRPECVAFTPQQCFLNYPVPLNGRQLSYVIWLGEYRPMPYVRTGNPETLMSGRRLLIIPVPNP